MSSDANIAWNKIQCVELRLTCADKSADQEVSEFDIRMSVHDEYISKLQLTRCEVS